MSLAANPRKSLNVLALISFFAIALVVFLVIAKDPATAGDGASVALEPGSMPTQPDPDEDIHSLPSYSQPVTPADKSTMLLPKSPDHTFDPQKDFEVGVLHDDGAPVPSIIFLASNYWNGFVDGHPVTVYGGYPGYEHPNDGAVYVMNISAQGQRGPVYLRTLPGVGALNVVNGSDDQTVTLVNSSGDSFTYDLRSHDLQPQP